MQGLMTITKEWAEINTLDYVDVNGNNLSFSVEPGDTVKFHGVVTGAYNTILLWQGTEPQGDNKFGSIAISGDVILGVGVDQVYLKAEDNDKSLVVEIIKGA